MLKSHMTKSAPTKAPGPLTPPRGPTVSIQKFIAAIRALPETLLEPGGRTVWYRSQKQHWLGWLKQYNTPCAYDRMHPGKDAKFAYNHIVNPQMLLWLIGAAVGNERLRAATSAAGSAAMVTPGHLG